MKRDIPMLQIVHSFVAAGEPLRAPGIVGILRFEEGGYRVPERFGSQQPRQAIITITDHRYIVINPDEARILAEELLKWANEGEE